MKKLIPLVATATLLYGCNLELPEDASDGTNLNANNSITVVRMGDGTVKTEQNSLVILSDTVTNADGSEQTVYWQQESGPQVTLTQREDGSVSFTSPEHLSGATTSTTLNFSASTVARSATSESVTIKVYPLAPQTLIESGLNTAEMIGTSKFKLYHDVITESEHTETTCTYEEFQPTGNCSTVDNTDPYTYSSLMDSWVIVDNQLQKVTYDADALVNEWLDPFTMAQTYRYLLNGNQVASEMLYTFAYSDPVVVDLSGQPVSDWVSLIGVTADNLPAEIVGAVFPETAIGYQSPVEITEGLLYVSVSGASIPSLQDMIEQTDDRTILQNESINPVEVSIGGTAGDTSGTATLYINGSDVMGTADWEFVADYYGKPAILFNVTQMKALGLKSRAIVEPELNTLLFEYPSAMAPVQTETAHYDQVAHEYLKGLAATISW